jgi:hypothetical protein
MRAKLKESEIQKSIIDYFLTMNILFTRHTPVRFANGRIVNTPLYDHGVGDLIVYHNHRYIEFEVKSQTGRQSKLQKLREERVKAACGEYYIIRSLDSVIDIINHPAKQEV